MDFRRAVFLALIKKDLVWDGCVPFGFPKSLSFFLSTPTLSCHQAVVLAVNSPSLGIRAHVCRKRLASPQRLTDSWLSFLDFGQSFENCHPNDPLNLMGGVHKARGRESQRRLWREIPWWCKMCKMLVLCSQASHWHGVMGKHADAYSTLTTCISRVLL